MKIYKRCDKRVREGNAMYIKNINIRIIEKHKLLDIGNDI
jgi:hypothetical protein